MTLLDKLKSMTNKARDDFSPSFKKPYVHKMETSDELYRLVVKACKEVAKGCGHTLLYHWDYVYSDNKDEWEQQKIIREQVVNRLRSDGLTVISFPDSFPEPIWLSFYKEWEQEDGHHYIEVEW